MALTPLTRVQQATVLALVEARRLDAVPADFARATSFLRQAQERLEQLPLLTSVTVRYGVAYDACHDTGEALLAAYGFRTTNGPGQHEALGRYLLERDYRWVVFTATREVRALLRRLCFRAYALAPATPAHLPDRGVSWGSYYAHKPSVMAGRIG